MDRHAPPPGPDEMPPVRSQADLQRHWATLMGELGSARPALWLQLLGVDGRTDARLTKVEDLPARPDQRLLENLLGVCGELLDTDLPGGSVAFLYTRPGPRTVTETDRCWAAGLIAAAKAAGVPCLPVHLAAGEEVRVVAADDLDLPRPLA